jgi:AraC family transcriptional regulator
MIDHMEPAFGEAGTLSGMTIDWLFTAPGFGLTRWDCFQGRREMSEEKRQSWHVISFVHAGAFVLHAQGRSTVIDSTAVLLYNPEAPFRSEHPFGCCDHGSAISVRQETLLDVMAHYDPTAAERPEALFTQPYALGLSRAYLRQRLLVQRLRGTEPQDSMALEAAVLRILGEVAEGCSRLRNRPAPRRRDLDRARRDYVEDTKSLLQQRFRESLRLADIGRALHVSTFHLCRVFKEETGVPIHRYLNRLRLRQALEALLAGEEDLSELALSLGFASHSHFTNAFRKELGMTPREVRRLRNGGAALGV